MTLSPQSPRGVSLATQFTSSTLGTQRLNEISGEIIDAAMAVHSALGPGLMERIYEICLQQELKQRGLKVKTQIQLPVHYNGLTLDSGYRLDVLVEDAIIVELKSVDKLQPIHQAQLLTYLKLANKSLGLLINFNTVHLKDGIKRMVHRL
ncbi:GxxExxY protein [Mariprofundus sp. EBB-1]|uniref:GxxExxY protein n=1 Tax=Mariprofundus sp. EBB-1 TaxID=2650971 RepID=UPI000EF26CC5|nr:GxxExxY protein [Mariprofundus sp. EBB-1]RLL51519.1 GxxExxY protein [Mariprofundus sp. EBB-1]